MTDTEVRKVTKTVPKLDIRVPHSVLETFDEYGEVNFKHMLAVGQHLFEQFAAGNFEATTEAKVTLEDLYTLKCIM